MSRTDRNLMWAAVSLALVALVVPILTGFFGSGMVYAQGGGMGMMPGTMAPGMMSPGMMPSGQMPIPGTGMMAGAMGAQYGWQAGFMQALNVVGGLAFWGSILTGATFLARRVVPGHTD